MPNELILNIQPYPYIHKKIKKDGSIHKTPEICLSCTTDECISTKTVETGICKKGITFVHLSQDIIIHGIVATSGRETPQQIKAKKKAPSVKLELFSNTIQKLRAITPQSPKQEKKIKRTKETTHKDKITYKEVLHEFKSIIATIVKNINVIVETKKTGAESLEEKLEEASNASEKAIYYASRMLEAKLHSFEYIENQNNISNKILYTKFRFHGLLHKYIQIYKSYFSSKQIQLNGNHNSQIELYTNADAIAVIIQNYLENACKYSPSSGNIVIHVTDSDREITFSITSSGPKINDHNKIFEKSFREESAQKITKDGLGFGLYISKKIADELKIKLNVEQDKTPQMNNYYKTTFSLHIPFPLFAQNCLG